MTGNCLGLGINQPNKAMRRSSQILLVLCLLFITSFTPKKEIKNADNLSKVERLYLTCKIWGFLKYYHPTVGKGVFDWDDKLLGVLKNTSNTQTYTQFNTYLFRWIYAIGARKPCTSCKQRNSDEPFQKNFDLSWTRSSKFSNELKEAFRDIENNRFEVNHFYIGQGNSGQFEPKNEPQQIDLIWKDENQRLLVLFRYWNYIEYFHPYKYKTDQDWNDVLKEMIPKFIAADSQLDFHLAMLEMTVKADDSNAGLVNKILDQWPYYNYLPVRFDMVEDQAVVVEVIDQEKARAANLQVGDVITMVNGQSVKDLHDSHTQYIWGSNEEVKERSIYHTLFMGMNESPRVTIRRGNSERTANLTLYHYSDISYGKSEPKEKWTTPNDSIGYVNMGEIGNGDVDNMMSELMDKAVIIFDLRAQPKGTYRAIANYLKPSSSTFALYTKPDLTYPGKFVWDGQGTCGQENEDYYKGKVILLVNENTQGHAEFTCMCFQTAPNVVTVGSQTAGTDGAISKFAIYAQNYTSMTATGVYYPDRGETQRVGIVPEIKAEPTIAGVQAGRDEVYEKAMEVAREELARLQEIARLEELARQAEMDSLRRLDSLRVNSLKIDSLQMDTLKIDSVDMSDDGND